MNDADVSIAPSITSYSGFSPIQLQSRHASALRSLPRQMSVWHWVQINPRGDEPLFERPMPLYPSGPWLQTEFGTASFAYPKTSGIRLGACTIGETN
jgi:hypothetical protein